MGITAGTIIGLLASGYSADDVLKAYLYLEKEDIQAAVCYAAWRIVDALEKGSIVTIDRSASRVRILPITL